MDHPFDVGQDYHNRKGNYQVLAIEGSKMRIRYEDGLEAMVTIKVQARIWQAMKDQEQQLQKTAAKSGLRRQRPPRHVTATDKEKIKKVMTYMNTPAGQMRLYKALWDVENRGLTFAELAEATHGDLDEARGTLGALGNRVTTVLGEGADSRLLIEHWRDNRYYLSAEMLDFIEATPSFKEALQSSEQWMFDRRTPTAWQFKWHEDGRSGYLEEFTR